MNQDQFAVTRVEKRAFDFRNGFPLPPILKSTLSILLNIIPIFKYTHLLLHHIYPFSLRLSQNLLVCQIQISCSRNRLPSSTAKTLPTAFIAFLMGIVREKYWRNLSKLLGRLYFARLCDVVNECVWLREARSLVEAPVSQDPSAKRQGRASRARGRGRTAQRVFVCALSRLWTPFFDHSPA